MLSPQFILDLNHELAIDNFAGGGGASTGIERALGRHVDHAINHDRFALGMHRINHPQTVHHCEDVFAVDPAKITEGRPVGMAWFSPDCKHFSKAKGGKPVEKKIRGLALVMLRWAKMAPPRVIFMENVEEIVDWGPLMRIKKNGNWGHYPNPRHKGRTWKAFLACLGSGIRASHPDLPEILEVLAGSVTKEELVRGFGYQHDARQIRGCSHGDPTIRKRLFMIARRDGKPIVWPEPTHADPKLLRAMTKALGYQVKPWRTVAECIDWSLPCPSIFLEGQAAKAARCKRPLAQPTLRRLAYGVDRYMLKASRPFLVNLTHQGGERVESVEEPAKTITGANRGEKAVVAPVLSKFHGNHDGREDGSTRNHEVTDPLLSQDTSNRFGLTEATLAPVVVNSANSKTTGRGPNTWPADEPLRTLTAAPGFNVGQATLAPFVTEHANSANQRNMPADEPMRTACAEVKGGHFAVVTGTVVNTCNGKFDDAPSRIIDPESPLPTITGSQKYAALTGTLVQTGYGEREGQAPRALDVESPLGTIVAGACKHAVVTGTLIGAGGPVYSGKPIAVDRPFKAQTTENHTGLATASLIKMRGENIGHGPDEPLHTVSAGGTHHGVVTAVLAQCNGGFNTTPAHEVTKPISTVSATGSQQQLVMASMTKFNTGSVGQDMAAPLSTITAGSHSPDTHGGAASTHGIVAASVVREFGNSIGQSADEPAPTVMTTGAGKTGLLAASMAIYHGTEADGQAANEPAHTATTKARLGVVESALAPRPLTPEEEAGARRVAAFLREHGVEFEGDFATVTDHLGQVYVIVDLGMRMLTPRELFRAQGFPDDYIIDQAWLIDPVTGALEVKSLTKEQQIRMCGNSVNPGVACALVKANVPEMIIPRSPAPKPRPRLKPPCTKLPQNRAPHSFA